MEVYDKSFLRCLHPSALDLINGLDNKREDLLDDVLRQHIKRSKRRTDHRGIYNVSIKQVRKNLNIPNILLGHDGDTIRVGLRFNNLEIDALGAYLLAFRIVRSKYKDCERLIVNGSDVLDLREIQDKQPNKFVECIKRVLSFFR